jgi:hypothetical protein
MPLSGVGFEDEPGKDKGKIAEDPGEVEEDHDEGEFIDI